MFHRYTYIYIAFIMDTDFPIETVIYIWLLCWHLVFVLCRVSEGVVLQPSSIQSCSYPVQAYYPLPVGPPITSHMPPAAEGASDTKMLAKATRALQEHVKDMTEKTKTGCCMGKHSAKENMLQRQNNILNAPVPDIHYITDRTNGITYAKGKLLGKVRQLVTMETY